jgi:hypothetical protein
MTEKTYNYAVNTCLVIAGAAVFFFDQFSTQLVPGSLLLTAGLVALGCNVYARFYPLEQEEEHITPRPETKPLTTDLEKLAKSVGDPGISAQEIPPKKMAATTQGSSRVKRGTA